MASKPDTQLRKVGTLGIFAPSSPFDETRFRRGLETLDALGLAYRIHKDALSRHGFLAGADATRTAALYDCLEDPSIDVLMAARGGYGAHRILEHLDLSRFGESNKHIVGFSDVTALHAAAQMLGRVSVHGPVVTQLGTLDAPDLETFVRVLSSDYTGLVYQADGEVIKDGCASGVLRGGCLSVLVPLIGTKFLSWGTDTILLIEDVDEAPYRVDRMLTHLRLSGVLKSIRGIAVGDFVNCKAPRPNEPSIEDVLRERLGDLGVPVVTGFPFGHGARNRAVPLGVEVALDGKTKSLTILGGDEHRA